MATHELGSMFLCIFQTTIAGQTAQTEVPTKVNPLNSRQARRDCEGVARASFRELFNTPNMLTPLFSDSDPIKCVEIIEVKPTAEDIDEHRRKLETEH